MLIFAGPLHPCLISLARRQALNIIQLSGGSPALQGSIPWYSTKKRLNSALLASRVISLLCNLLAALRISKLHHFTDTVAQNIPELHIPHQPSLSE